MADPASKPGRRATYQDVLDAPEHKVAEIIDGELFLSPRPAPPHASVQARLGGLVAGAFGRGGGGPGGWVVLTEPELHLGDDVVVPDLAAWRHERMLYVPDIAFITLAPDWLCEVLSPSTEKIDRSKKLAIYGRAGVEHVWFIQPRSRTLEVLAARDGTWSIVGVHVDDARVRAAPFEAIELDLANLWADFPPPTPGGRAAEAAAVYGEP
jgi:Uma2 family endonuclease